MKTKPLLVLTTCAAVSSILPIALAVSCGSANGGSQIRQKNNTFIPKPYTPFIVKVPSELFPGVKLDYDKYNELEKAEQELNQPQVDVQGNYTFKTKNKTKNGFFTFQVQKELFGSNYFGSVANVEETIKNAIAQMAISPAIMMDASTSYMFNFITKNDRTSQNPITFSKAKPFPISSSTVVVYPRVSSGSNFNLDDNIDYLKKFYSRVVAHEFNHGITLNSWLIKPGAAFQALQQILNDTKVPLEYEKQAKDANAVEGVQHNFSNRPEEWVNVSNEEELKDFTNFIRYINGEFGSDHNNIMGSMSIGTYFSEIIDFIRGAYMTPIDYKASYFEDLMPIGRHILDLSYLTPGYNYFNIDDQLQSYNIMKAWAKYSLNMANGNNVELTYDASSQNDQIKEINFSSFGMAETNDISEIEIYDKSKNLTTPIYTQKVSHQDFPFGFNKNPFNDYEYKYVAPSAYLYDTSAKAKINIAPQNVVAKIALSNTTEDASSIYCVKDDNAGTAWKDNKWQVEIEKTTI